MMNFFEKIVLGTPYLFLKKIPYAWVAAVALWAWPPVVSGIFAAIILLGLSMMALQQRFWEAKIRREHQKEGNPYRDQPRAPMGYVLRNIALVLAASALLGAWLDGQLRLEGWQWFLLSVGLMFLYRDALVFGASAVYLVTPHGIGVRYIPGHVDYRLFFKYNEISQAVRVNPGDKLPAHCLALSPLRKADRGVLLRPVKAGGFSREIGPVLLTPTDLESFMQQLPGGLTQDRVRA